MQRVRVAPVSVIHDQRLRGHGCRPRRPAYVATNSAPVSFRVRCLAPAIPVVVAAPPMPVATPIPRGVGIYWPAAVAAPPIMPVATPIPWGVGIYWLRNHGRCVIARHHWSCVDRSRHHVDLRCCINRGCIDRRCRVRRWGRRRCVAIGRCRQISDRFWVAVVRSLKPGPMRRPLKMPKRLRRERELYSSPISLVVLVLYGRRPYIF